jgi:hypothetical protein
MSARETIAKILRDAAGSGESCEMKARWISEALTAAGFSIVHKDEIHAPSVWGDDNELSIEWPGRVVLSFSPGEDCGYTIFRDGKWQPGKFKILDEAKQAAEEIAAALRELMKEVGE